MFLITPIAKASQTAAVLVWDVSLTLLNLVIPNKKAGHVVPEGHPGAGRVWPPYVTPKEGDSRCSCPVLNAMANHGNCPNDSQPYLTHVLQVFFLMMVGISLSKNSIKPLEPRATFRRPSAFLSQTLPRTC